MDLSKRLLSTGLSLSLLFSGVTCLCVEPVYKPKTKASAWSETPSKVRKTVVALCLGNVGLLTLCKVYKHRADQAYAETERERDEKERKVEVIEALNGQYESLAAKYERLAAAYEHSSATYNIQCDRAVNISERALSATEQLLALIKARDMQELLDRLQAEDEQ